MVNVRLKDNEVVGVCFFIRDGLCNDAVVVLLANESEENR